MEEPSSSPAAQALSVVLITSIALSIIGFIIETVPEIARNTPEVLHAVEVACTIVFTAEYCTRLAVCDKGGMSRRQFLLAPLNILDLVAFMPFYLELILHQAGMGNTPLLRAFRLVRLVRVTRVFKLGRYAAGMQLTAKALAASWQAISVLIFLLMMGAVLFSSALYYLEKLSCPAYEELSEADLRSYDLECADPFYRGVSPTFGLCCTQDGAPNDFPSIVAATWWSIVTMTSVGYGEVHPRTTLGKCVGFVVMLVGMVVIALPVAIVGQKFQDVYEGHHVEMSKSAAAARMQQPGKVWTLVPASGLVQKLEDLQLKDRELALAVKKFSSCLNEVWEQREQLMRERKSEFERQVVHTTNLNRLLTGVDQQLRRAG